MKPDIRPKKWKWYVYELSDGFGVFYVGKGCGKRISSTKYDGSPEKLRRAKNCKAEIIAYFIDEDKAFAFEKERMNRYENLANIADYPPHLNNLENIRKYANRISQCVYPNVEYKNEHRLSIHKLFETCSKEINRCPEVARVRGLVDILEFAIEKLPKLSKPLNPGESPPLIICSN